MVAVPPLVFTKTGVGAEQLGGAEGDSTILLHLGRSVCGHDGIVHGGMLATVCDEALARTAMYNLPGKIGVTARLEIDYRKPTMAHQFIVLQTELVEKKGRKAIVKGTLKDVDGQLLLECRAIFVEPKYARWCEFCSVSCASIYHTSRQVEFHRVESRSCPTPDAKGVCEAVMLYDEIELLQVRFAIELGGFVGDALARTEEDLGVGLGEQFGGGGHLSLRVDVEERRVGHKHVKRSQQLCGDCLGLVEVVVNERGLAECVEALVDFEYKGLLFERRVLVHETDPCCWAAEEANTSIFKCRLDGSMIGRGRNRRRRDELEDELGEL
ncbi:hypothetical protein Golomagni_07961, partial [Golovinomyces magnicellulatus]